jgi:hypothetical protein
MTWSLPTQLSIAPSQVCLTLPDPVWVYSDIYQKVQGQPREEGELGAGWGSSFFQGRPPLSLSPGLWDADLGLRAMFLLVF